MAKKIIYLIVIFIFLSAGCSHGPGIKKSKTDKAAGGPKQEDVEKRVESAKPESKQQDTKITTAKVEPEVKDPEHLSPEKAKKFLQHEFIRTNFSNIVRSFGYRGDIDVHDEFIERVDFWWWSSLIVRFYIIKSQLLVHTPDMVSDICCHEGSRWSAKSF